MAIEVTCPSCLSTYELSDTLQGKSVRCKKCGQVFRIANVTAPPVVLKPAPDLRGGIQSSPVPLRPITPQPQPLRDEGRSQEPARQGSSTLKILLIVFGSLAGVGVLICGGVIWIGYRASQAIQEKTEEIRANVEANVPAPAVDVSI